MMKRCPITYETIEATEKYSQRGLKRFSRSLKKMNDFPYTMEEQILKAAEYADKLSIQGVQPKLSVRLNLKQEALEIVETGGVYILKPPNRDYKELPENEDVTMKMAETAHFKVPFHGLIYNVDNTFSYFIKRFDRLKKSKIAVEDFSQLSGFTRDTKYEGSMEKVASTIEKYATVPMVEKLILFKLTLFSFLVGNEDMHLKNFSLIREEGKVVLSPVYDLLNSTLAIPKPIEEMALTMNGKKSNFKIKDFDYFGMERLKLPEKVVKEQYNFFHLILPKWFDLIEKSFLSERSQEKYKRLIQERAQRLF